ncbi:MAG: GTPase [Desulfosoma sp.]
MLEKRQTFSNLEDLWGHLHDVHALLTSGSFLPIKDEDRRVLQKRLQKIEHKLHQLEDRSLLIGLVGGTGVGKSTLMNVLAQEPIASVSHRRPHTDRVLLYRHVHCVVPGTLKSLDGIMTEVVHEAEAARHMIMADLPDFDSLVQEHRQRVLAFMEHLDLVLWVTTPEKYADGRFYEMLREAPKSRENFAFVLNKADLLFSESDAAAFSEDLLKVVRSFERLVRESGVKDPVLYVISAGEVLQGSPLSPWNQFPFLRRWVFRERNAKEIRAIKEANLDAEFQALILALREGMEQLERAVQALNLLESSVLESGSLQEAASVVQGVLSDLPLVHNLSQSLQNAGDLSGAAALLAWVHRLGDKEPDASHAAVLLTREVTSALEKRFQEHLVAMRDQSVIWARREGLAEPLRGELLERLHESLDRISIAKEVREAVTFAIIQAQKQGVAFMRRRQRLWSFMITTLFLLALGGQEAWRVALADPGMTSSVALVAAMVEKLFSGQGLAALGSWAFLQLVVGARFYREYKKSLQQRSEAIIDTLQSALEQVFRQAMEQHLEVIRRCREEMKERLAVMGRLGKSAS